MFRNQIPFRNKIIILVVIYGSVAALFGAIIPILHADRVYDIITIRKNYNSTKINITKYEAQAGKCTKCYGGGVLTEPGCYDIPGYYGYAIVKYNVWENGSIVEYTGFTYKDVWCGATPSDGIAAAEYQYGPVGSYDGYYLLSDHYDWYFHLPGRDLYLAFVVGASVLCTVTILSMIIHLCCLYNERRQKYTPITVLINEVK